MAREAVTRGRQLAEEVAELVRQPHGEGQDATAGRGGAETTSTSADPIGR